MTLNDIKTLTLATVAEAKGVMQLEMTLEGYESHTEASMLAAERGDLSWTQPPFDEQIEGDYVILIALDQPSGELAFVEATYVDFDSLVASMTEAE